MTQAPEEEEVLALPRFKDKGYDSRGDSQGTAKSDSSSAGMVPFRRVRSEKGNKEEG